jgi:hypothetical protein
MTLALWPSEERDIGRKNNEGGDDCWMLLENLTNTNKMTSFTFDKHFAICVNICREVKLSNKPPDQVFEISSFSPSRLDSNETLLSWSNKLEQSTKETFKQLSLLLKYYIAIAVSQNYLIFLKQAVISWTYSNPYIFCVITRKL